MAAIIQRIAIEAYKSFKHVSHKADVTKLCQLLGEINAADVAFESNIYTKEHTVNNTMRKDLDIHFDSAPVRYIQIWEDEVFTMGIFVLKSGFTIPLHDHPKMTGLIRVIHGCAQVQSYTALECDQNLREKLKNSYTVSDGNQCSLTITQKQDTSLLTPETDVAVLYPVENNYHNVKAIGGVMAFIDIISPPYDDHNTCTYFKDITDDTILYTDISMFKDKVNRLAVLKEIPLPQEFWCHPARYSGPIITKDVIHRH